MEWGASLMKFLDPYDLKARLLPGLLVLLPAIVYFGLIWGPKNPLLVTLMSILTACGGPYLLSSFVRTWGQRAQERLYARWGGQPTTLMLQHRSDRLSEQTKLRYHALIASKLGVTMPTPADEAENPNRADRAFDAAADALRPLTNDKKKYDLLYKELVSFGYNRNCHGSRYVGLAVALSVAPVTLMNAGLLTLAPPYLHAAVIDGKHGLVLLFCVVMTLLWCAHFTERAVEQSGFSYAKRLWELLEKIPRKPTARDSSKHRE